MKGWIGVDLDGTLAIYDGWKGADHIGAPIPSMIAKVKKVLADGIEVKIFTARISHDGTHRRVTEAEQAHEAIVKWCREHIGTVLTVTNVKDYGMIELWDDRAKQVIPNTGMFLEEKL